MREDGDLILRVARRDDMADLRAILYDTFDSTWRPNITEAAAQAFIQEERPDAYVNERGLLFLVAEIAGEVVGFVDWVDDFVHALHVRSARARQGIGRRLMDHAEAQIARAGFASSRLETDTFNQPSQAFYAARGYREAERYPDEEWNSGLTTILLVKPLS
jgi:ribosomal protein S18 acetylase RimI-like enzyme